MDKPNPNTEELARSTREHELKIWPEYFEAVESGAKPFEVRKIDRDYQPGDILRLREWYPNVDAYSGRECSRRITGILGGGKFGVADGYCVLGISPIASAEQAHAAKDSPTPFDRRDHKTVDWVASEMARELGGDPAGWLVSATFAVEVARKAYSPTLQAALAGPCPICNGIEGCDHTVPERTRALASLPTLQDEGVRAALEPFAAIADHYADQEYDSFCVLSDFDILGPKLTLGMFRKARSVLATLSRGETVEPVCQMCDGRGEIGGFDRGDNAWRTEPCPECAHHHEAGGAPGRVTAEDMALLEALAANEERTAQIWAADHHADRAVLPSRKAAMMRRVLAALGAPGREAWRPIETAPKSTSQDRGQAVDPLSGKTITLRDVRGVYLLGYCPEDGATPEGCISVVWWEPHQHGDDRGCWFSDAGEANPTHWMPLPATPGSSPQSSDHEGREQVISELCEAGSAVLDGLNARIDAASADGQPVPVFAGIAALHDALARARGEA